MMNSHSISFPDWKMALGEAGFSPREKSAYAGEIIGFLRHCKVQRAAEEAEKITGKMPVPPGALARPTGGVMLGTPIAVSTSPFDRPRVVREVEPLKVPSRPRERPGATRRRRSRGSGVPRGGQSGRSAFAEASARRESPSQKGNHRGNPTSGRVYRGNRGKRNASELAADRGKRRRSRGSAFAKATARRESRSHRGRSHRGNPTSGRVYKGQRIAA